MLEPKDNSRIIVWTLVGLIALTVGGFIIVGIVSRSPAQDGLTSVTTTTAANTAAPTTIEEVLACVCDIDLAACDPECACDPLCPLQ